MKNLTIFRSQNGWNPDFEKLNSNLSMPGKLGYSWKILREGLPYIRVAENILLTIEFQSKLIPTQVINIELKKELEKIEAFQGYKAGKKQKHDIKEAVITKLHQQAFVTSRFTNIWINTKHNLLCIETTSQSVSDYAISLLVKDLGYSGKPIVPTRGAKAFMRQMISNTVFNDFELGSTCVLSAPGKQTIHYKNERLDTQAVRDYLADGRSPIKLELSFRGDEAIFTFDENFKISKISFPDIKNEKSEGETEEDYFDSTFTIHAGQCLKIINALLAQLSEEKESQGDAA